MPNSRNFNSFNSDLVSNNNANVQLLILEPILLGMHKEGTAWVGFEQNTTLKVLIVRDQYETLCDNRYDQDLPTTIKVTQYETKNIQTPLFGINKMYVILYIFI